MTNHHKDTKTTKDGRLRALVPGTSAASLREADTTPPRTERKPPTGSLRFRSRGRRIAESSIERSLRVLRAFVVTFSGVSVLSVSRW
jgi:hypothetical protein